MTTRWTRTTMAVVAAAALALSACGDDSGGSSSRTTTRDRSDATDASSGTAPSSGDAADPTAGAGGDTTAGAGGDTSIGKVVQKSFKDQFDYDVPDKTAACFDGKLTGLSEDQVANVAVVFSDPSGDTDSLDPESRRAVGTAFDECFDKGELGELFAALVRQGNTEITEEQAGCIGPKVADAVIGAGGFSALLESTSSTSPGNEMLTAALFQAYTDCGVDIGATGSTSGS